MYGACIEEVLFLSKQLTILINMHLHYFYCVSRPSASAYRAIVVVYASGRTCLHLFISLLLCCCRQICAAIIIFTCPVPTFHGQCIRNKNCILYSGDEYILGSRHDGSASWLSVRTQEKNSEVAKDNRESIIYLSGRILKYNIIYI